VTPDSVMGFEGSSGVEEAILFEGDRARGPISRTRREVTADGNGKMRQRLLPSTVVVVDRNRRLGHAENREKWRVATSVRKLCS
jgi:hypothetical protein